MNDRSLSSFPRRLVRAIVALLRKSVLLVLLVVVAIVVGRAYLSTSGPPLRPWHTIVPEELSARAIEHEDWRGWIAAENTMFEDLHRRLQAAMDAGDRTPLNRYNDASRVAPMTYGRDWNRSYVLEPAGAPVGVAVMLHGLTDSPYSMRSLAELYRQRGFVAIVPRMPGHGTVPAGLTREGREAWNATVDMAMAEAGRRATAGHLPVHLVGYSNGAALALLHVTRRIERNAPPDADRLVLLSPMIEVNRFARYAGLAGLPAVLGRYAKTAWLDLLPEYNAFKYNSFPVHAARESYLVTADLQEAIDDVVAQHRTGQMPPILAFESVVDDTVSARAVMSSLFDKLGGQDDELVLFDVNRSRALAPILRSDATDWPLTQLQAPRPYTLTLVGTTSATDAAVVARSRRSGAAGIDTRPLGLAYPRDVYSLSHIALPFPDDDPLYGNRSSESGALQLGGIAIRGERNVLVVSQDSLDRLGFNPFFGYMAERIAADIHGR